MYFGLAGPVNFLSLLFNFFLPKANEMYFGSGVVVEKWILYGTFLTSVDFGALGYSTDALADITASLRMDRCVLVY